MGGVQMGNNERKIIALTEIVDLKFGYGKP